MDLQELEVLLIDAQKNVERRTPDGARHAQSSIIAAKFMVQAEMARIERIRAGAQQNGDERRN